MESILSLKNVRKTYGAKNNITNALAGLNFEVFNGQFIGIMGPSGSGKTTLLNAISTIDEITSGDIHIGGKNITKIKNKQLAQFRRKNLGFIFQDFNLLDTLTLHENIALPLTINKTKITKIDDLVNNISEKLNIKHLLNKFPYEVSGGEKQRTACARAIVTKPQIILADEPTGSLDSKSGKALLHTIKSLNEDFNTTIVMVTHDAFAASYCERILFLKDGSIYKDIKKNTQTQKSFYNQIMQIISATGGIT